MSNNLIIRNIIRFVVLMVLQVVIFNQVSLWGYVLPMLYVLFVLMLPTGMNKIALLLIAFATGLTEDLFCNLLGFHACACTVVALCRILFADKILTRNETTEIEAPSVRTVTPQYYMGYLALMMAIFYVVFFALEVFDFHDFWYSIWQVLAASVASSLATTIIAVLYQIIFIKQRKQ